MDDAILVRRWERKDEVLAFKPSSGEIKPTKLPSTAETFGFCKKLGGSDSIIVYSVSKKWWIQRSTWRCLLSDVEAVIKARWPIMRVTLSCGGQALEVREFAPFRLLFANIDPTYDGMDVTSDFFSAWLVERIDSAKARQ